MRQRTLKGLVAGAGHRLNAKVVVVAADGKGGGVAGDAQLGSHLRMETLRLPISSTHQFPISLTTSVDETKSVDETGRAVLHSW